MSSSKVANAVEEEPPSSTMEDCCRVCGADGATRHYGSVCCSGCKGFFRRSVRFQMLYTCPRDQNCPMDKKYRNCCRACRLQKCLAAGMDPRLVQSEWGKSGGRKGGGKAALIQKVEEQSELEIAATPIASSSSNAIVPMPIVHHNQLLNNDGSSLALGLSNVVPNCGPSSDSQTLANFLVSVERFCEIFVDTPLPCTFFQMAQPRQGGGLRQLMPRLDMEVPMQIAHKQPTKICGRFPIGMAAPNFQTELGLFGLAYGRLMVHYLDWSSHFPELQRLDEEDKRLLLMGRAMQCVWLFLCFHSAQLGFDAFAVSCDMFYPTDAHSLDQLAPELRNSALVETIVEAMGSLVRPFREMHLTEQEFALLRAISLFTPVAQLSREGHREVVSVQNKYLNALSDLLQQQQQRSCTEDSLQLTMNASIGRMNRLLLFLATIERVNQRGGPTFSAFSAFGTGGMRGSFTYDLHLRN